MSQRKNDDVASKFTHFDRAGKAHMVNVAAKAETERHAVASGRVQMMRTTLSEVQKGNAKKGDVLGIARLAGLQAVKQTSNWIPLCHPVRVVGSEIRFEIDEDESAIEVIADVWAIDRTGVEMEAIVAVSAACLTIYDMCKAVDRGMEVRDIRLLHKSGGKSGTWQRE